MQFSNEALFFIQAIILIGVPYGLWSLKIVRNIFPVVVLQVLIGILLGPSIFGKLNPHIYHFIFPQQSLAFINGISWIAVTFLGFLTGLHFDMSELKKKGRGFVATSISSLLVPFAFAIGVMFLFPQLYPMLAGKNATPFVLYLAIGIIASVTALPVLAAIIIEMKLLKQTIGKIVLSYATVNDGFLWILVSILFALVSKGTATSSFMILRFVLIVSFFLFMIFVVRPFLKTLVVRNIWTKNPTNIELVTMSVLTLTSALIGELLGIHYFLTAFLFGAIIPKEIALSIYNKKEPMIFAVLLPFFFMSTGLKTVFDFTSSQIWIIFGTITTVSLIGKFIGVVVPSILVDKAKLTQALVLGVFMQCKGLMEIVVLTLIFSAGVINAVAFSGMILMALVATAVTKPLALLIKKVNPEVFN